MKFNLPLILVLATGICGLVWLIDRLFFSASRRRRYLEAVSLGGGRVDREGEEPVPWYVEYARSFFPVLLIVLVLRSFIFEPFRIPSGSMIPTLLIGDFILVSKFSYGLRLPVINKTILETNLPERGDVAVFRFPDDPSQDFIKRVVGLPGDRIVYHNKTLFINGEEVQESDAESFVDPATGRVVFSQEASTENLLGVEHEILKSSSSLSPREPQSFVVPEKHYFMMGDNRDNSNDSRSWGTVPEDNLVGKAVLIWLNYNKRSVQWNRIGDKIK